ncbi:hypothetical protein SDC9_148855 [bioreactor metagenome]|uniref:Uncharacterized protein n=1 Tax=bioreactor metagenome TaxID=1076179 RepID=A0A645EI11_9ZZZZ
MAGARTGGAVCDHCAGCVARSAVEQDFAAIGRDHVPWFGLADRSGKTFLPLHQSRQQTGAQGTGRNGDQTVGAGADQGAGADSRDRHSGKLYRQPLCPAALQHGLEQQMGGGSASGAAMGSFPAGSVLRGAFARRQARSAAQGALYPRRRGFDGQDPGKIEGTSKPGDDSGRG